MRRTKTTTTAKPAERTAPVPTLAAPATITTLERCTCTVRTRVSRNIALLTNERPAARPVTRAQTETTIDPALIRDLNEQALAVSESLTHLMGGLHVQLLAVCMHARAQARRPSPSGLRGAPSEP